MKKSLLCRLGIHKTTIEYLNWIYMDDTVKKLVCTRCGWESRPYVIGGSSGMIYGLKG